MKGKRKTCSNESLTTRSDQLKLEKKSNKVFFCTVSYDRSENQTVKQNSEVASKTSNEETLQCTTAQSNFGWPCQSNRIFHILPCFVYNERTSHSQEKQDDEDSDSETSIQHKFQRKLEHYKERMKKSKKTAMANTKTVVPKKSPWKQTKNVIIVQISGIMRNSFPWLNQSSNNNSSKKTPSFNSIPNLRRIHSNASELITRSIPRLKSDLFTASSIKSLSFESKTGKQKSIFKRKSKNDSNQDDGENSKQTTSTEDSQLRELIFKTICNDKSDLCEESESLTKVNEELDKLESLKVISPSSDDDNVKKREIRLWQKVDCTENDVKNKNLVIIGSEIISSQSPNETSLPTDMLESCIETQSDNTDNKKSTMLVTMSIANPPMPVTVTKIDAPMTVAMSNANTAMPLTMSKDKAPMSVTLSKAETLMPITMSKENTPMPVTISKDTAPQPVIMLKDKAQVPVTMSKIDAPMTVTKSIAETPIPVTMSKADTPMPVTMSKAKDSILSTRKKVVNSLNSMFGKSSHIKIQSSYNKIMDSLENVVSSKMIFRHKSSDENQTNLNESRLLCVGNHQMQSEKKQSLDSQDSNQQSPEVKPLKSNLHQRNAEAEPLKRALIESNVNFVPIPATKSTPRVKFMDEAQELTAESRPPLGKATESILKGQESIIMNQTETEKVEVKAKAPSEPAAPKAGGKEKSDDKELKVGAGKEKSDDKELKAGAKKDKSDDKEVTGKTKKASEKDKKKEKPKKGEKKEEEEVVEEIVEPVDLPPEPLAYDDIHLRYIYENNWYNEMFERLIQGHPPKDPGVDQKKMKEVEKKLTQVAKKYGKNAKDYFPLKLNAKPAVEVTWDHPIPPIICNCPFSICTCIERDRPTRKCVPSGYRSSRNCFVLLLGLFGISRSPKGSGTLMPKLNKLVTTEAHVAREKKRKRLDTGPEFCTQRCASYYKDEPLVTWKKMKKWCKKKKKGKKGKEEEILQPKTDELAELQQQAKLALKEQTENVGAGKGKDNVGFNLAIKGIDYRNEYRTTRYTEIEEEGPEEYSHILFGKLPIQQFLDLDGTKLELKRLDQSGEDLTTVDPSILDKMVTNPTMQKHISKIKNIYSSVFGVDPRTLTTKKPPEELKPWKKCYPEMRQQKVKAIREQFEAKEEAKLRAIETARRLAKELEEPVKPTNDERFKAFELKPKLKKKKIDENFPAYKLKPQSTISQLRKEKLEELIRLNPPPIEPPKRECNTKIVLSTTETVSDRYTKTMSDTTATHEINAKQFWIERDKAALIDSNKIIRNKVVFKKRSKTYKGNRTNTSTISSDQNTPSSAAFGDISTPISDDTDKSISLSVQGKRVTENGQSKQFNALIKERKDQTIEKNKQKVTKTKEELNSLMICGSKIASGPTDGKKVDNSDKTNTSLDSSALAKLSTQAVNDTTKSDIETPPDDVVDNISNRNDTNDSFDTFEDLKDDSFDGNLTDSSSDEKHEEAGQEVSEALSNTTVVANYAFINKNINIIPVQQAEQITYKTTDLDIEDNNFSTEKESKIAPHKRKFLSKKNQKTNNNMKSVKSQKQNILKGISKSCIRGSKLSHNISSKLSNISENTLSGNSSSNNTRSVSEVQNLVSAWLNGKKSFAHN